MIRFFRDAGQVAVSGLIRITMETSYVADYPVKHKEGQDVITLDGCGANVVTEKGDGG